ncbi:MAG: hypothetical protein J6C82_03685 [Clostridia bacterium]|nr:hypothetical protein [Clostridia bacterium]
MSIPNELTARVIGDIISKGMNMCGVNLEKTVKSEAIDALGEIKEVMDGGEDSERKLSSIEKIMERYNIK